MTFRVNSNGKKMTFKKKPIFNRASNLGKSITNFGRSVGILLPNTAKHFKRFQNNEFGSNPIETLPKSVQQNIYNPPFVEGNGNLRGIEAGPFTINNIGNNRKPIISQLDPGSGNITGLGTRLNGSVELKNELTPEQLQKEKEMLNAIKKKGQKLNLKAIDQFILNRITRPRPTSQNAKKTEMEYNLEQAYKDDLEAYKIVWSKTIFNQVAQSVMDDTINKYYVEPFYEYFTAKHILDNARDEYKEASETKLVSFGTLLKQKLLYESTYDNVLTNKLDTQYNTAQIKENLKNSKIMETINKRKLPNYEKGYTLLLEEYNKKFSNALPRITLDIEERKAQESLQQSSPINLSKSNNTSTRRKNAPKPKIARPKKQRNANRSTQRVTNFSINSNRSTTL